MLRVDPPYHFGWIHSYDDIRTGETEHCHEIDLEKRRTDIAIYHEDGHCIAWLKRFDGKS